MAETFAAVSITLEGGGKHITRREISVLPPGWERKRVRDASDISSHVPINLLPGRDLGSGRA
jgi:hypothetical protein